MLHGHHILFSAYNACILFVAYSIVLIMHAAGYHLHGELYMHMRLVVILGQQNMQDKRG